METQAGAAGAALQILRRWPVVLVVAVPAVAAALLALSRQDDSYVAKVRMVITPLAQQDDSFLGTSLIRDAGDAARTTATVAETMDSARVYAETASRMGGGWSAPEVEDAIEVKPVAEANVVEVSAEADSEAEGARLAEAFATATLDLRWQTIAAQLRERIDALDELPDAASDAGGVLRDRQLLAATVRSGRDPTLRIQGDEPNVSQEGISSAAVVALALLGGLLLGCLAALAGTRLGGRIRSEDDALASYPLPILARVMPEDMLRTAKVLPDLAWQGVFGGLAARIAGALPNGGTALIASPSDGDGRSSSATSLVTALTDGGWLATLVELQPRHEDLAQVLGAARQRASFVIVDAPPLGTDPRVLRAAALADVVLIVVRVGHTDRQELRKARRLLDGTGVKPAGLVLIGPAADGRAPPRAPDEEPVSDSGEALTLNR